MTVDTTAAPLVMVTVAFVILMNLVADILYAVVDPRISYG